MFASLEVLPFHFLFHRLTNNRFETIELRQKNPANNALFTDDFALYAKLVGDLQVLPRPVLKNEAAHKLLYVQVERGMTTIQPIFMV